MPIFSTNLPVAIGSDHAGFDYKKTIIAFLQSIGYTCMDCGTYDTSSVDYPDYAHPVASAIEQGKAAFGVLICGSANGVAITANKHNDVRAAICWENELASLARQHNNANIICIPARFVSDELAVTMVETFVNTAFEGGRHANRVAKINC